MYYNYITGGFGSSFYGVATSPTPKGPFTVVNPNVLLLHTDNGDENIFVDDDGSAYIIYTSLSVGHSISIELLSPDYLNSTLKSSGIFGESFVEVRVMCAWGAKCSTDAVLCPLIDALVRAFFVAIGLQAPAMFKRGEFYYATFGSCCCYCESGSPVSVYTATSPLGPYSKQNVLGAPSNAAHKVPTHTELSPPKPLASRQHAAGPAQATTPTPANPFCGLNHQENVFELSLFCINGVIDALPFVSYGTPVGSCPGPFERSACDSATFIDYATSTCIGNPNCTLVAPMTPDPCLGTVRGRWSLDRESSYYICRSPCRSRASSQSLTAQKVQAATRYLPHRRRRRLPLARSRLTFLHMWMQLASSNSCTSGTTGNRLPMGSNRMVRIYVALCRQRQCIDLLGGMTCRASICGLLCVPRADFTVWAPLTFASDGNVSSTGFVANFTVSVGT